MNKTVKGSLAGAAGVALLMGGFGSYALWSDSEDLGANGVSSGVLTIDTSAGSYDDANTAAAGDWTASDKMVPGDKVTYTQTFSVAGTGKNLKGSIALANPGSTNTFSSNMVRTVKITSSNGTIVPVSGSDTSFTFASPFNTATLTAVVTYDFSSATSGTTDQGKSYDTPATTLTISQS
jgi:alternate signal-mediated exported protein